MARTVWLRGRARGRERGTYGPFDIDVPVRRDTPQVDEATTVLHPGQHHGLTGRRGPQTRNHRDRHLHRPAGQGHARGAPAPDTPDDSHDRRPGIPPAGGAVRSSSVVVSATVTGSPDRAASPPVRLASACHPDRSGSGCRRSRSTTSPRRGHLPESHPAACHTGVTGFPPGEGPIGHQARPSTSDPVEQPRSDVPTRSRLSRRSPDFSNLVEPTEATNHRRESSRVPLRFSLCRADRIEVFTACLRLVVSTPQSGARGGDEIRQGKPAPIRPSRRAPTTSPRRPERGGQDHSSVPFLRRAHLRRRPRTRAGLGAPAPGGAAATRVSRALPRVSGCIDDGLHRAHYSGPARC